MVKHVPFKYYYSGSSPEGLIHIILGIIIKLKKLNWLSGTLKMFRL